MSSLSTHLNFTSDSQNISYNVYKHSTAKEKIANITADGTINNVNSKFVKQPSLCVNSQNLDCRQKCGWLNDNDHTYIHGEQIIVLSTSIHVKPDPNNRWACISLFNRTLFRTEAAAYALSYLKSSLNELNDMDLGLLVIDSCGDKMKTAAYVYDLLRGTRKICDRNDQCFDPKKIVAFLGDGRSSVSKQLHHILHQVPIIQISYGASSTAFNDRMLYPYFLRPLPPDDLQSHFMVSLLKKLNEAGSQIDAVNLIYTDGLYGRSGAERLLTSLAEEKICININVKVSDIGANDYDMIVGDILAKAGNVKIILLFLDPPHLDDFMTAVNSDKYRHTWMNRGFVFISSDSWNNDKNLLDQFGDIVKGSFSFKINSNFTSTSFGDHVKRLPIQSVLDTHNPWLVVLQQEAGKCKIRGNFLSSYSPPCSNVNVNLTQFVGEAYSLIIMKTISATVYALRSITFDNKPEILFDHKAIEMRYKKFLEITIAHTLEGTERIYQPFTQKSENDDTYGNGKVGYTIFNVKLVKKNGKSEKTPDYVEVQQTGSGYRDSLGDFTAGPEFYLMSGGVTTVIQSTSDTCLDNPSAPPEAPYDPGKPVDPQPHNELLISVTVLSIFLILVLFAAIIGFFVLRYRRMKARENRRNANTGRPMPPIANYERDPSLYDQIPYSDLMSESQKNAILKLVSATPGRPLSYINTGLSAAARSQYYNATEHAGEHSEASGSAIELSNPTSAGSANNLSQNSSGPIPAPRSTTYGRIRANTTSSGTLNSHSRSNNEEPNFSNTEVWNISAHV